MKQFLAYFLCLLMLLQSLGRELLVLDYALNKARITALYCVNKARPRLHCNGKCYLARKLRKATDADSKTPGTSIAKVKLDVLLPLALLLPAAPGWAAPARRYARPAASCYVAAPVGGTFRPPAFQG